jgi:7,8-dihydropterin-6-yl-methyl-4-(beta-D-ribofuranosyl)aminobenzene 5'-phosphate synthase
MEYDKPRKLLEETGYRVDVASLSLDRLTSSDGFTTAKPKIILTEANPTDYDAVIFAGYIDSKEYYQRSQEVYDFIHRAHEQDVLIAGICLGVSILNESGVLKGVNATIVDPAEMCKNLTANGANCTHKRVERDGTIITAQGPSTAGEFAIAVVEALSNPPPQPTERQSAHLINLKDLTITILYDNTSYDNRLTADWGFSALIEVAGQTILFDTGMNGEILKGNIELLGLDLEPVDAVVLSHNHRDHTGGLEAVLDTGITPTVYVLDSAPEDFKRRVQAKTNLISVSKPVEIYPAVYSTGQINGTIPEQSLVLATQGGSIVITGCAHPGIVRIVRQAIKIQDGPVALVLGGFHLGDKSRDVVLDISASLRSLGVQQVAPTHCTGEQAMAVFAQVFGSDYIEAGAGRVINFEDYP